MVLIRGSFTLLACPKRAGMKPDKRFLERGGGRPAASSPRWRGTAAAGGAGRTTSGEQASWSEARSGNAETKSNLFSNYFIV